MTAGPALSIYQRPNIPMGKAITRNMQESAKFTLSPIRALLRSL